MNVAGYWHGSYQQTWPETADPIALGLRVERRFWFLMQGLAFGGDETAPAWVTPVRGRLLFGRLTLAADLRSGRQPAGSNPAPLRPQAGPDVRPGLPGPVPAPTHFDTGRLEQPDALAGTWRAMTWWMLPDTRRKVPVVLARGIWRAYRAADTIQARSRWPGRETQ